MIKNIIFDLDGTLINTHQSDFNNAYFKLIVKKFVSQGFGSEIGSATLKGLELMYKNDGKKTNEMVFWDCFDEMFKANKEFIKQVYEDFYNNEYDELKRYIEEVEYTKKAVKMLKKKGYNLIIATNPVFPLVAISKRIKWGGLDIKDFSYISSYENSCYCKPNINYYKDIIKKNNLNVNETMMFGNDLIEDLAIEKMDVPCYIIMDNVNNLGNVKNCHQKGDYNDFYKFISNLPKVK